ncbi:hypothetical protein PCASD_22077 [Puccinia coronata f. sp. avenae]|uniref:Uncharacterized protein n=1 Tax=Puccinia coronata f. sp. avenae TaxID=200324 RepID=A0A2N5SEK2_9BASI|nr:hypothetical protein PCASD_24768 [Puccinia coronata f. sp. avenae]PLW30528.1 hypothetical protein PCASD_22077 [Puccinia coronata f. sp. avenae]
MAIALRQAKRPPPDNCNGYDLWQYPIASAQWQQYGAFLAPAPRSMTPYCYKLYIKAYPPATRADTLLVLQALETAQALK